MRPFTPWYSDEINEAKKVRRKYEMKWHHTKLTVHKEMYLEQKYIVGELITKAKTEYYMNKRCWNVGKTRRPFLND